MPLASLALENRQIGQKDNRTIKDILILSASTEVQQAQLCRWKMQSEDEEGMPHQNSLIEY